MIENIKRPFRQRRLRNVPYLVLLIAVGPTAALNGRCPSCFYLRRSNQDFDNVTPPVLPTEWLATNALGPPPIWVTLNSGVPSPAADTPPPNARGRRYEINSLTSDFSSFNSATEASIFVRLKSLIGNPCTISHFPPRTRTGNDEINPFST